MMNLYVCANFEHSSHVERLQMEAELQRYRSLEEQGRSWELKVSQLCELVRVSHGNGHQIELPNSGKAIMSSLNSQSALISSHVELGKADSPISTGHLSS